MKLLYCSQGLRGVLQIQAVFYVSNATKEVLLERKWVFTFQVNNIWSSNNILMSVSCFPEDVRNGGNIE